MKAIVTLKQNEIKDAIRVYLAARGIDMPVLKSDVTFLISMYENKEGMPVSGFINAEIKQ